jgi:hypothetical protein
MGGSSHDIEVRLVAMEDAARCAVERRLSQFDAAKARCFYDGDRQRLLGAIEAVFGTADPFNRLIREMFAESLFAQGAGGPACAAEGGGERSHGRSAPWLNRS